MKSIEKGEKVESEDCSVEYHSPRILADGVGEKVRIQNLTKKEMAGGKRVNMKGLGKDRREGGMLRNSGTPQREGFHWKVMGRLDFSRWNGTQLEMTEP